MTMAPKPLMLKDFLELDWDSEPSGASFQCAPRRANDARSMRHLLDAELRGERRLPRTRSISALRRISSVLNAVKLLPFSDSPPSGGGILSRSFSRRISVSFWRKRARSVTAEAAKEDELRTFDDVRRSCDLPSLAVSRCSSWSESECSFRPCLVSSSSISSADDAASAAGDSGKEGRTAGGGEVSKEASAKLAAEREGKESPECHSTASSEEEKEQLSPVSVMDFPSEEDDDDEEAGDHASNSFRHSLAKLERRKLQLLHKIGRFESLTCLDPVNLDRRFATCDDDDRSSESTHHPHSTWSGEEEDEEADDDGQESTKSARKAWGLLQRLTAVCHVGALEESVEKLLVDFFIHGLSLSCSDDSGGRARWRRLQAAEEEEEALLRRARDWVEDLADDDDDGEETLREMDGDGWRRCRSEVAVELEGLLLRSLVAELVVDLASR